MQFRKTHKSGRKNYTYEFSFRIGGRENDAPDTFTITPGLDGITDIDIKLLHYIDDAIVDNNIENHRMEKDSKQKKEEKEWETAFQIEFEKVHGYRLNPCDLEFYKKDRFPSGWFLSIEQTQEFYGDKSSFLTDESDNSMPYESEVRLNDECLTSDDSNADDELQAYMNSFRSSLSETKLYVFDEVMLGGRKKKDVAEELGLSDVRISQIAKELEEKLRKDEKIRKIFSRTSVSV